VTSDTSNVAQQPPASTKHTKPVHRKQKGFSTSVSLIPHLGASVIHTPLDMQPFRDLFNPDTADDTVSISANGRHFSTSDPVDTEIISFTPTLPPPRSAHKRSANGALESSSTKRFKSNEGLLHSDIEFVSSGASATFGLSPPPATQPMVSFPQVTQANPHQSRNIHR